MVESGVGIDFFIAAPAGRYMDIATIGLRFFYAIVFVLLMVYL